MRGAVEPQTDLFHQTVTLSNRGDQPMQGARIHFPGLPSGWELYNSAESDDGVPYVEADVLIPPGSSNQFEVPFLVADGIQPAKQNFAVQLGSIAGAGDPEKPLQIQQTKVRSDGSVAIEFTGRRSQSYLIEYSDDLLLRAVVPQPVVAVGSRMQWVDDGPPKTIGAPAARSGRCYRIVTAP